MATFFVKKIKATILYSNSNGQIGTAFLLKGINVLGMEAK
jgi:hypothetical protein